jgi:AraC-like DNA-binding protein
MTNRIRARKLAFRQHVGVSPSDYRQQARSR